MFKSRYPDIPESKYSTSHPVNYERRNILVDDKMNRVHHIRWLKNFHQFFAPTFSHLLALLLCPTSNFITEKTSLLVIDSLSTAIFDDMCHYADSQNQHGTLTVNFGSNMSHFKKATFFDSKQLLSLSKLSFSLTQLAIFKNLVVAFSCQMVSSSPHGGLEALLYSIIQSTLSCMGWETCNSWRVVILRN